MDSHRSAMRDLIEAIAQCRDCNSQGRHAKEKGCHIRQCARAVRSSDPAEMRLVADQPCLCGYSWPRCTSSTHMEALDRLADVQLQDEQWISAIATAMGMIRLDPTHAAGYCRVAKVMRALDGAARRATEVGGSESKAQKSINLLTTYTGVQQPAQLRSLEIKFIKAGLREVEKRRVENGAQGASSLGRPNTINHARVLQLMAHRYGLPAAKRDPTRLLPLELVQHIFSFLSFAARICCLRVNRNWYRIMMATSKLWTQVELIATRPTSDKIFLSFLNRHPEIQTFIYDFKLPSNLSAKRLSAVVKLPSLKRLLLRSRVMYSNPELPSKLDLPRTCHLTQLRLVAFKYAKKFPGPILELASGTLEVLQLLRVEGTLFEDDEIHPMPRLRKLAITGASLAEADLHRTPDCVTTIAPIARATPNLEEFLINGLCSVRVGPWMPEVNGRWKSLRIITIGEGLRFDTRGPRSLAPRCFPPPTNSMEKIDIMSTDPLVAHNYLFTVNLEEGPAHPSFNGGPAFPDGAGPAMPNLHTFRCRAAIAPPLLQRVLELPAGADNLRVLELAIIPTPSPRGNRRYWHPPVQPAGIGRPDQVLSWLRCEHLEHIGLHDFNFLEDRSSLVGPKFDGSPFTNWIDSNFPSVHSVAVYPGDQPDVERYIFSLIMHPKVRIIWQESLHGVNLEYCHTKSQELGVDLRIWPKNRPSGPDFLVPEDHMDSFLSSCVW
ncbi:hypothetical protein QBC42DRAFT_301614 [Cladorrhinum samala]|uniref:F-box domain-containing protein n=1 Tax=Cladorrhinum samala TaxID=585594 RepID=A0AAV9HBI7_9PEZI|nr:hypothetical protein QBC42DRAFT_301614 [Cladorrhinum samala]